MNDPIDTLIEQVTDAALSPRVRDGVSSERTLVRNAIANRLKPALVASEVLLAWASGEISEGRACELLQINRATLRKMRILSVGRVTGDMDAPAIATKRAKAIDRMDQWVEEYATDRCSASEAQTVRTFWKRARSSEDFLQRLDDWRGLCPPGVALFSSEGES